MKFFQKDLPVEKRDEYEFVLSLVCFGLLGIIFIFFVYDEKIVSFLTIIPFCIFFYLAYWNNKVGRKQQKVDKQSRLKLLNPPKTL